MSLHPLRRTFLLLPCVLTALAGCSDTETTAPPISSQPLFAQGDNDVWTVNSLADPGDGVCDDANCTLREAVTAATPGGQVVFAGGLSGTIPLAGFGISIDESIGIDAAGQITVDGRGLSHVLVVGGDDAPIAVSIAGITLKNGFSADGKGANLRLDPGLFAASVTVLNSVITDGTSMGVGGGIYVGLQHALTLINSTVDNNTATGQGGGIYNLGTLILNGTTVSNNQAASDGALSNRDGASATIARSTISGNRANGVAGSVGAVLNLGSLQLRSSTVTGNTSLIRGGLAALDGTTVVENSIIAGNVDDCDSSSGALSSLGHNLAGPSCNFAAPGDVAVLPAQVFTQVLDQGLQDNGGPTRTHALLARGLAIDAGYCPGETTDQRGFTRPVDDPTMPDAVDACDIGAYEAQGPLVAVADLMISQTVDKGTVKQGELLTYTIRVQNLGPQTAPNVVVNNVLSSGVTFVAIRANKGTTTAPPAGETGTVTWYLGDMLDQANEVAEISVTVLVRGKTTITNSAAVAGDVADPNTVNNAASITVSVGAGGSRGGPKKSG